MRRKLLVLSVKLAYKIRNQELIYLWEYLLVKDSGLFDANYYLKQRPDVKKTGYSPIKHFIRHGWQENTSPLPLFNIEYYKKQKGGININPFVHYLIWGDKEGINPHPLFSISFYQHKYGEYIKSTENHLEHFIKAGRATSYFPSSIFLEDDSQKNEYVNSELKFLANHDSCMNKLKKFLANGDIENFATYYYSKQGVLDKQKVFADENNILLPLTIVPLKNNCKLLSEEKLSFRTDDYNKDLMYPQGYLAYVENVLIIGGTRFIIKDGKMLSDEIAEYPSSDYGIKKWQYFYKTRTLPQEGKVHAFSWNNNNIIEKGILISCDHDENYFHWLIECLPMVLYVMQNNSMYKDFPLLIEDRLHPNLYEALKLIIGHSIEVLKLPLGGLFRIKQLIVPGDFSRMLDRYHGAPNISRDAVLGPLWIKEIRTKLLKNSNRFQRKIYLRRGAGKGKIRILLNEAEIELYLLKRGFEIVNLDNADFAFQRELFSQTKIVVAPTGATCTNMVLSPEGATFVILLSEQEVFQPQIVNGKQVGYWKQLADICGLHYYQCNGPRAYHRNDLHDDFIIPISMLEEILSKAEEEV